VGLATRPWETRLLQPWAKNSTTFKEEA